MLGGDGARLVDCPCLEFDHAERADVGIVAENAARGLARRRIPSNEPFRRETDLPERGRNDPMTHARFLARLLFLGAGFLAAGLTLGCPKSAETPAPGYSGPLPSVAARHALHAIEGQILRGTPIGNGGPGLTVESFAVVPNPVTGLGPIVTLTVPGGAGAKLDVKMPNGAFGRWVLPVVTDGDAADLILRVTGQKPEGFGGALSAEYKAALGMN